VLELWLTKPHDILVTVLVGNTVANTLASALMTDLMSALLGDTALSVAVGVTSFLILVFGEITPKTLAREHAMAAAVPVMLVMRVVHVTLLPVTWFITHLSRVGARLTGASTNTSRDVTQEEIEAMIDLASREGTIAGSRADTLRAVFHLADRSVREIMVPRTDVMALDIDLAPADFVLGVDQSGHSRIPVFRGSVDEVVGVLHAKDLLHHSIAKGQPRTTEEIRAMLRDPLFVPETMRLDTLLRLFRRGRQHLAVVLEESGGTAGIATLEDVLEELVGEIWDEHDEEDPVLVRRGPGRWTADGRIPLSVLEEKLGLPIPSEASFETLGGLLMEVSGEVPRTGQTLEFGGYRFEVLTGDEKRVGLVRAVKLEQGEG
jgi:putative hemolysin